MPMRRVSPRASSIRASTLSTNATSAADPAFGIMTTSTRSAAPSRTSIRSRSAYSVSRLLIRTMRTRGPKSSSRSARTTLPRLAAFSSGSTESSRSRQTASAALAAALAIIAGRDPGTNSMLRMNRAGSSPLAPAPLRLSTVMDFSAYLVPSSERSRHAKHMLANVRQDQIRRDRRNLIQARLAKLAFHVVIGGESETAERLQTHIRRLPRGIGGKQLRQVRLRASRAAFVEQPRRLVAHQVSGAYLRVGARDRKLNPLVLPDRPIQHHPFVRVGARALDEPVAVPDAFGGNQDALRVHAVEDVAEPLALLADQVIRGHLEILEEHLVGLVVDHVANGPDGQAFLRRPAQIDEKDRQPFGLLLHLRQRGRPREQQHQIGVLHPRRPHLLAVDHVAVAAADGRGPCLRRVGAGRRFGDGERLEAQAAGGDLGQVAALLLVRPVT